MTIVSVMITAAGDKIITQATSTKDKINQTENEKNALQGQLNESQENLEGLKNSQNSLKGELAGLKDDMTEISNNLEELEKKIAQKITEIEETQVALDEARATEEWQQECMVIRAREMYERNDTSYLNAIINAGSLSDMLNVADYFEKIASYDRGKLQEFIENRQYIEAQEALLESEKAEFENLKAAAEAEKNKVQGMISKTANSISKYADQISEEEQHALEIEAEIKKKEEDLVYLKQKLAEEMAMSQTAANSAWRDISEVSFTEGDRYLLANLIYCEAGGEPYAGQLAVGSVVINRVLSSVYPDSVVGVIYQNKQFSPVASGRLELALASNKATASCYKAADEAMAGVTNVGTCVYFRTPVEGLTGISIGGHIFY
ncbi:MAG: cell wall hydrolase [Acetatifactor sp.]|nr:cell wall hydrolase [Acetatifactor sp.]